MKTWTEIAQRIGANPRAIRRVLRKLGIGGNECERCGGSGYIVQYSHVLNGVCFACEGVGGSYPTKPTRAIREAVEAAIENGSVAEWKRGCVARREAKKASDRIFAAWGATRVSTVYNHMAKLKGTMVYARNSKMCDVQQKITKHIRSVMDRLRDVPQATAAEYIELMDAVDAAIEKIKSLDVSEEVIREERWVEIEYTTLRGQTRKHWQRDLPCDECGEHVGGKVHAHGREDYVCKPCYKARVEADRAATANS